MHNYKKCGVIGCGNVGATTAYTLMISGLFTEIVLADIDTVKASGEAEDIAHGIPFNSPSDIYAGNYDDLSDAGIVIITAGVSQRQGETRLDLLQRNAKVFSIIIDNLKKTDFDGIKRIKNRILIFLHILVICKGQTLHNGEKRYQVAENSAALTSYKLCNIGILLLGHDA